MNLTDRIVRYLRGRKTPATAAEIARAVKAHPNSVRRTLFKHEDVFLEPGLFKMEYRPDGWNYQWHLVDNQE